MRTRYAAPWLAAAVLVLVAMPAAVLGAAPGESAAPSKPAQEDDYELQRILVDTLDQVQRNYVREVSRRKLVEAAIKGILSELDPYSSYIGPEDMDRFRTSLESEFGGIGIQVSQENGQLRVISPLVGTPAYRAGILAGDHIVEIDGKSTAEMTMDEAVRRLKGQPGTQVTVTVIHSGQTARERMTITREVIHIDTVLGDRRKDDDRWDFLLDTPQRIGYIRIAAFSRETPNELRRALEELKREKFQGLILDLRFNPGGLLSSAIEVCDLFVSEGRIVSTAGRNSPERVWEARKEGTYEGFPMAVLVNRYSASGAEIVAACLQDHKRAVVVGERTWGKGSVQNVIPLDTSGPVGETVASGARAPARSALKLTTAGYRRPSGKNIDKPPGAKETDAWGVLPDPGYEVPLTPEQLVALVEYRRQRDIVAPKKPASSSAVAENGSASAKAGPGQPTTRPAHAEPVPSVPAQPATPDPKPSTSSAPKPSTVPAPTPSASSAPKPSTTPAPKASATDSPQPASPHDPIGKPDRRSVDPQLQKAIEYLSVELARAR